MDEALKYSNRTNMKARFNYKVNTVRFLGFQDGYLGFREVSIKQAGMYLINKKTQTKGKLFQVNTNCNYVFRNSLSGFPVRIVC